MKVPANLVKARPLSPYYDDDLGQSQELETAASWATPDDVSFVLVPKTVNDLPPDCYKISYENNRAILNRMHFKCEDLLAFNDSQIKSVVDDITNFWTKEEAFKKFDLQFKRGILLYGPPGSGKSSVLKLVLKNVIGQGGIAIDFSSAQVFIAGMKAIRHLHPDKPILVIMEDIEAILENQTSEILNILDGINGFDKVCYLATTNYPELLEGRIKNRPSRFDRRYFIGSPDANVRAAYLNHLKSKSDENIDIALWVKSTEGFSFAHLKELFISVVLFGQNFNDAIKMLSDMKNNISSESFEKQPAGFNRHYKSYNDFGMTEM